MLAHSEGDRDSAYREFHESLRIFLELEEKRGAIESLRGLADVLFEDNGFETAVRLLAAANSLSQTLGIALSPRERDESVRLISRARSALGEAVFEKAWIEGVGLSWQDAVSVALSRRD
jgi:hypothetical protein